MTTLPIIRISISEAARLFGLNQKTIRQAIKLGHINYVVVRGRYKLNFASVLEWSQSSTRRRNIMAKNGLGSYVEQWKITNRKYSPRPPV
ncbi:excisionase family DNA-binding protein [Patescibacteria group bacterium]|nr:excisionase family DNA-binding protein [Patescibacteria group bacterium]